MVPHQMYFLSLAHFPPQLPFHILEMVLEHMLDLPFQHLHQHHQFVHHCLMYHHLRDIQNHHHHIDKVHMPFHHLENVLRLDLEILESTLMDQNQYLHHKGKMHFLHYFLGLHHRQTCFVGDQNHLFLY